jgi:ABC transport system ATP-binding/permease protein
VIADYEGTVLIVSHDRDFLDRTVTITLGLDGSSEVDIVAGGYEDWVRQRYKAKAPPPLRRRVDGSDRGGPTPSALRASSTPASGRGGKLSYKNQRDYDRLPGEIERMEAEVAADEAALADPDLYARDTDLFATLTERIARNRAEIEAAELRWLEVAEMAEQLVAG